MTERRPLILRADTAPPRLQELPSGDLLPADTLGNALKVLLAGLVTSNSAGIVQTDTVLQALGKLQAQTNVSTDLSLGAATANSRVVSISKGAGITLPAATSSTAGLMTAAESAKLSTVATSASANSSDAFLLNRANHSGTQPLSTISDAGTAAARNVQTSATDVTSGSLMAVGAFGIGRLNPVPTMNLNNFGQYPTGKSTYYLNEASNGPYPSFYGYLEVDKVDDTYLHQTLVAVETGIVFKRTVNYGNVQGWVPVIDAKSAVGPIVSGAIIERGSNSNGEYIKLIDGTAMVWGYRTGYVAGDNFTSLPLQFVGGSCASSLSIIPSAGWQTPLGWYASTTSFVFSMPLANATNGYVFFAVGRWK